MDDNKIYQDGISASAFVPVDRSKLDAEELVRPSVSYWQGGCARTSWPSSARRCWGC